MQHLIFALYGLLMGGLINALADALPQRAGWKAPHCLGCGHRHRPVAWLAISRWLVHRGRCPACDRPESRRGLAVELGTAALFALLPALIPGWSNLMVNSLYIAVLILIIVTDLEHRLIFNVVTLPATLFAVGAALLVTDNNWYLALGGAVVGFLVFYFFYWVGQLLFGPGALGFGDVTLSMTMGAMLGLHRIIFALILGILIGGVVSAGLLLARRTKMRQRTAYGPYLAVAGIVMLIWGIQVLDWYIGP